MTDLSERCYSGTRLRFKQVVAVGNVVACEGPIAMRDLASSC